MAVRLNITIDEALCRRLKRESPPRGISAPIEGAARNRLRPNVKPLEATHSAASSEDWRRDFEEE